VTALRPSRTFKHGGLTRLRVFIVALVVLGLPVAAPAQTYPDRPVRMIIAFSAGGSIDALGRVLAQRLTEVWGQNVVVENRPGGGATIGAVVAARAAPDGYTLHLGAQSLAVNVTAAPSQDFDPLRDFEPVILIGGAQDVLLVPPSSAFHSVGELIANAKAHPGELNTSSLGVGSSSTLATLMFTHAAGIKLQPIPYTAPAQIATDLLSGRLALSIPTLGGRLGDIQTGKARALAVSGPARSPQLPDVPTFAESGIKFVEESSWYALFAPHGVPQDIVLKINADVNRILALPEMKRFETTFGYRFIGGTPDHLREFLKSEIAKWAEFGADALLAAH
jgi:tripartite-type tricarboxylate transporter receptor subunit TctC